MRKSEIYALLGLTLETCIHRFHFPTIDLDIFSPADFNNLRNQLSKVPANNQKLAQQTIQQLLKGKVEEIKTKDEALILSVQFEHNREQYIAELMLENSKWAFLSIHYAGQAPQTKQVGIWTGVTVVALSILLFSTLFINHYFQEKQATSNQIAVDTPADLNEHPTIDSQPTQGEELPISELEQMAKKMDLVLINEEEYQNLLREKEQRDTHNIVHEKHEDEQTATKETSVVITVYHGMTAEQVAKLLVESEIEVAQDIEELTKFFIQQEIQYRIRTGAHEIPLDATYMDIVHILTNRK